MDHSKLREVLEQVCQGLLTPDAALELISQQSVAALEFATVDLDRRRRCGFPEVVFAQGKSVEQLKGIVAALVQAGEDCLATRLDDVQAQRLGQLYPNAEIDAAAHTFWLRSSPAKAAIGQVAVVTAGTSDLPVAMEAWVTARAMGCDANLIADVGVAGLHRLLRRLPDMETAHAIIVVAGMDGALPSVVGGLVSCPVIAVPTSIGYGTSFHGVAALLTMLNACSANVVTVNIDAGFKAGYVAALIARAAATPRPAEAAAEPRVL